MSVCIGFFFLFGMCANTSLPGIPFHSIPPTHLLLLCLYNFIMSGGYSSSFFLPFSTYLCNSAFGTSTVIVECLFSSFIFYSGVGEKNLFLFLTNTFMSCMYFEHVCYFPLTCVFILA